MKIRFYESKHERLLQNPVEERDGQLLSAAPGGVWLIPRHRRDGDPVAFFGHRGIGPTGPEYYVIEGDGPTVKNKS